MQRQVVMNTVSVIMPCFNHAQFVAASVNSVLRQTHHALELIITEDRSLDNSWEVISQLAARDSRIKAIRHERNEGLSKSRNDAMRAATGDFIAFCDSDDLWEPDKLEIQLRLFAQNPTCSVVYCDTIIVDEHGALTGQRFSDLFPPPKAASGWLFHDLVLRNFINIQSVVMRKECLQHMGLFDETIEWIQDWWYWVRLSRHYQFFYSEQPLARYRIHSASTNSVHWRSYCLNRLEVFGRILREYSDLTPRAKADINYEMGVDLCSLGRNERALSFLWQAVKLSMSDARAFGRFCKACARIVLLSVRLQKVRS